MKLAVLSSLFDGEEGEAVGSIPTTEGLYDPVKEFQ